MSRALAGGLAALGILALAGGCSVAPRGADTTRYEPVTFDALPGWSAARLAPALRAFAQGCERLASTHVLAGSCSAAQLVPADDEPAARRFVEDAFQAYSIVAPGGAREGLITGYYEPIVAGSRKRGNAYRHPIYGLPSDLLVVDLASVYPELTGLRLRGRVDGRRVVPYFSRAEIDARGSAIAAPVLAWVADPVELFFLQIQGSGQILLESGERMRVGYADQNGHPYRPLGRHLAERGEMPLEKTSMQGIRAWAATNPEKLQDALNYNASYVFFRELDPSGGPIGALGAPLTAGYSIAVDRRHVPLGAPVYLDTTEPNSDVPLARLMAAQDTGGAIRGAVRADFYWGTGDDAGAQAGRMRQRGRMWLLWPRNLPAPVARP